MSPQRMLRSLAGVITLLALLPAAPDAARSQVAPPGRTAMAPGVRDPRGAPWPRDRALRPAPAGSSAIPGITAAGLRGSRPARASGAAGSLLVDPDMWVTDGQVNAIATSGNTIYIGGSFSRVGPSTGSFVGIDMRSSAPIANWPQVSAGVRCSAADGAGGWYIGGSFTSVAGVARGGLAHIRADMTLDAWNPGANGEVICLAVSGTTVYVGGAFDSIGGQSRDNIAALDASTGRATPWNPTADDAVGCLAVSGTTVYAGGDFDTIGGQVRGGIAALDAGMGLATAWDPAANTHCSVYALALSGTTVYAGGYFTSIGGQTRYNIAALDAGTGLATPWDPEAEGEVMALAVSGAKVYAGGFFTSIGGQGRVGIAALDAGTGLASPWNPSASVSFPYQVYVPSVWSIATSGTTVYAVGWFTSVGGQNRRGLAALDANTGLATPWNPAPNNLNVWTLAVSGTTVCAGGYFTSVGGQERENIAALDAGTGRATPWNPSASGPYPYVQALAVSGSTVYAGGDFTSIGGQSRSGLAALDAGSGLATAWNPEANYHCVYALVVSGTTVYAGGFFTSIGGQSRGHIAALDAGTGLATPWDPEANESVRSLAVSGTTVYAGGDFTSIGGQARRHIAALDTGTGLATPWNPGANSPYVNCLVVSDTTVYAGGAFDSIGGQRRSALAALDAGTGLATPWNPCAAGGYPSDVFAIAGSGTTVYAGGTFDSIGGQNRIGIAALDAGTGLATPWNPGARYGEAFCLAVSGTTVYAGGWFSGMGGQDKSGFAAIGPADDIAPTVQVLSPNGRSPLLIGSQRQLSWFATDDVGVQSVDLYLSRTGPMGPNWELLAAGAPNTGSYLWTVTGPEVTGNNACLLVNARDYGGNIGTDLSNTGFIASDTVTSVETNGGVTAFALGAPAPNPVAARSLMRFEVPRSTHVRMQAGSTKLTRRVVVIP